MADFKNIKHFKCSLNFNLTHLLTVGVMLSSNAFLEEVIYFFHLLFDNFDVECASKYVARKHRILTTMNISVSCVIHTAILCCVFPFHRSDIYRSSQNHLKIEGRICFKSESCIGERGHHLGCYQ